MATGKKANEAMDIHSNRGLRKARALAADRFRGVPAKYQRRSA